MNCSWCGEAGENPEAAKCPRCGAVYAKAAALAAGLRATALAHAGDDDAQAQTPAELSARAIDATSEVSVVDSSDDPLELQLRIWALPSSLALAWLFQHSGIGRFFQRVFFSMPLHELGHAISAWLCGFSAVPTLWRTHISSGRSGATTLLVGAGVITVIFRALRAGRLGVGALCAIPALAQLIGTFGLSENDARAIVIFGGDAGAMMLGTALMAAFFVDENSRLRQGQLRWGLLVIGSASYVDVFCAWWAARHDFDAIPFGENEGSGLTDPTKLTDEHGWTPEMLVHRYIMLGWVCAAVLVAVWIWGVVRQRRSER